MTNATGWDLVAERRMAFADMIDGLQDRADEPSLCGHWTVHQVAAHLLTFTNLSLPKFMGNMLKNGFNYDKMADRVASRFADELSMAQIAEHLRSKAGKQSAISSFPAEMTLSDVTIHQQDIRRPLGLGVDLDPAVAEPVLTFLTTHKQAKAIFDPAILEGIELAATDLDWSFGSGDRVEGTAEALIMGLAGRPVADDLSGDGVAKLTG